MNSSLIDQLLQNQVQEAIQDGIKLNIVGGSSKSALGRVSDGETLDVSQHTGIIEYDPRELVITVRAGTPLQILEDALAKHGQMLAFEPPYFGEYATLGGTIACGLSGPRRPYVGSARDFVLGCKILNGKGDILHFGGQVIKNVAGYDISRLMAGAYGTLGILLELSLKVLPRPATTSTLFHECSEIEAIEFMSSLLRKPLPVDAACYYKGQCYVRLSGSKQSVIDAKQKLPGETLSENSHFWQHLCEHKLSFFNNKKPLWRIVVKPNTAPLPIEGEWLLDWGGAQRWLFSDSEPSHVRAAVKQRGGHATLFRGGDRYSDVFQPLSEPLTKLHQRLKHSFDPNNIFNPGRMYAGM